jgi:short-subunit dehydrogenase
MNTERKLALITGASSGIGLELARVFAKNDYDLVIASSSDAITERARVLRQYEVDVTPVVVDLATPEGVNQLWAEIATLGRPLDVAVLNAGVGVGGEFVNTDFKEELALMNLNMVYLVDLCKRALKDMYKRNDGKIMITSSIAAEMPGPYFSVYAASRVFLQSFGEAIRQEIKDAGKSITVTLLRPGATDTKVYQGKKDDPATVALQGFDALMSGEDHIVAGPFKNKVEAKAAKFIPETQKVSIQGKEAKPRYR